MHLTTLSLFIISRIAWAFAIVCSSTSYLYTSKSKLGVRWLLMTSLKMLTNNLLTLCAFCSFPLIRPAYHGHQVSVFVFKDTAFTLEPLEGSFCLHFSFIPHLLHSNMSKFLLLWLNLYFWKGKGRNISGIIPLNFPRKMSGFFCLFV